MKTMGESRIGATLLRIVGLLVVGVVFAMGVGSWEVQEVRCAASGECLVLRHHSPWSTFRFDRDDGWVAVVNEGKHPTLFLSRCQNKNLYLVAGTERARFGEAYNAWRVERPSKPFRFELRRSLGEAIAQTAIGLFFLLAYLAAWLPRQNS